VYERAWCWEWAVNQVEWRWLRSSEDDAHDTKGNQHSYVFLRNVVPAPDVYDNTIIRRHRAHVLIKQVPRSGPFHSVPPSTTQMIEPAAKDMGSCSVLAGVEWSYIHITNRRVEPSLMVKPLSVKPQPHWASHQTQPSLLLPD
jgi:hypothetical protein